MPSWTLRATRAIREQESGGRRDPIIALTASALRKRSSTMSPPRNGRPLAKPSDLKRSPRPSPWSRTIPVATTSRPTRCDADGHPVAQQSDHCRAVNTRSGTRAPRHLRARRASTPRLAATPPWHQGTSRYSGRRRTRSKAASRPSRGPRWQIYVRVIEAHAKKHELAEIGTLLSTSNTSRGGRSRARPTRGEGVTTGA